MCSIQLAEINMPKQSQILDHPFARPQLLFEGSHSLISTTPAVEYETSSVGNDRSMKLAEFGIYRPSSQEPEFIAVKV